MKLRVAIVTESFLPALNGVTNSVLRVLETLRQQGHEAIIIAPGSNVDTYLGYRVITIGSVPFMQFAVAVPSPRLAGILADFAPDVIHVASPVFLGKQAITWAARNDVPSVAIFQTDLAGYVERYGLATIRPAVDAYIASIHQPATLNLAPTTEGADYLKRLGAPGVSVWGRGVDLELYHPNRKNQDAAAANRKSWAPNGETLVGFVGRLAPEKQVIRMRELFDLENTRFVVIGDGPERKRLETEFEGHPVTFAGKLVGEELANAYAALDVFVHFGTEETFGQTIQEAQATGLPVVAPAAGGPKFLINSGVDGFLVDVEADNDFVTPVANLVKDAALRAVIGEGARRAVLAKSWAENNAKLLKHYREAMRIAAESRESRLLFA